MSQQISTEVRDAILEKPVPFSLNGRFFYLYQPSLGVVMLTESLLHELKDLNSTMVANTQQAILAMCKNNRHEMVRLVAYHTFKQRSEVMDEQKVRKRIKAFAKMDNTELATLFAIIIQWNTIVGNFIKEFRLDKERRMREKIQAVKSDSSNVTFGGKSMYGSLLDYACERYGWALGYVVWGISAVNLNMMIADSIQSVYLTEKERKQAHISTDGIFIKGDDRKNAREIQRLIKGK